MAEIATPQSTGTILAPASVVDVHFSGTVPGVIIYPSHQDVINACSNDPDFSPSDFTSDISAQLNPFGFSGKIRCIINNQIQVSDLEGRIQNDLTSNLASVFSISVDTVSLVSQNSAPSITTTASIVGIAVILVVLLFFFNDIKAML